MNSYEWGQLRPAQVGSVKKSLEGADNPAYAVNTENYDILNMIGITIKMQEYNIKTKNRKDAIKAIIDEGGFSGTLTALNFGNKFFPESELNSTNKDVIRLKLATLDMFLQNYPDAEASESILKKLKENETNKDVLSKVDQLLELE